jgi:hypothetical protein
MSSINSILDNLQLPLPTPQLLDKEEEKTSFSSRVGWFFLLLLLLAGYSLVLRAHYAPAISHPDANGYWAQGSLIVETGKSYIVPESDAQYLGMHWLLEPTKNIFVGRYPPGFPLVIGLVQHYFGWQASVLVDPVLSVLTLIGVYFTVSNLTRSGGWGLLAATALAINPAFITHALSQISHMPVAFEIVWGFYFLLRWSKSGRLLWIFLAGLILGCIPSTRYADSVVALGVMVFMLLHLKKFPSIWKHYLASFVGVMIPLTPLLVRNQLVLGAFWRTGYNLTNEDRGFGWDYFQQHALGYLQMLQGGGLGMMFALGTLGLFWMLFIKRTRNFSILTLVATTPFIMTYMAYYWAMGVGGGGGPGGGGGGGNVGGAMRFLVPIVPLFVMTGVWMLSQALVTAPKIAKITIPVVLLAMQATMYGSSAMQELHQNFQTHQLLAIATKGIDEISHKDDVVIGNSALLQQIDFVRKWKVADPSLFTGRGGGPGGGPGGGGRGGFPGPGGGMGGGPGGPGGPDGQDQSDQPSPQQQLKREYSAKLYTGSTEAKELKFHDDVLKWANGKDVYVVGTQTEIDEFFPTYGTEKLEIIKRIPTPKPDPAEEAQANNIGGRRGQGNFGGRGGFGNGPGGGGGPGGPGGGGMGGPGGGRRGGGPFGNFITPGEDICIAKLVKAPAVKTTAPASTQSAK